MIVLKSKSIEVDQFTAAEEFILLGTATETNNFDF